MSSKNVTQMLREARVLADLANLDPLKVDYFRNNYIDFVPQAWWDYQPTDSERQPCAQKQWQINQEWLREAWHSNFNISLFELLRLLTSVFDPNDLTDVSVFPSLKYRPVFATMGEIADPCRYHEAVMWLYEQRWRVVVCKMCGKLFVARHPKREYCYFADANGDTCDMKAVRRTKRKTWHKHKKQYRGGGLSKMH